MSTAKDPVTEAEWQQAVDLADAMLAIHAARCYGLVDGGPQINPDRCLDILERARSRGVVPNDDEVSEIIRTLAQGTPGMTTIDGGSH